MGRSGYLHFVRQRFVRSLRYEDDEAFSAVMGVYVSRAAGLLGTLGLLLIGIYLFTETIVFGKVIVWGYSVLESSKVIVLWDKLAMALIMVGAIGIRYGWSRTRPTLGRVVMGIAGVAVTMAIVIDDVASGNVAFSPAYVGIVLLAVVTVVPFRPVYALFESSAIVAAWWLTAEYGPIFIDRPGVTATGPQVLFLAIIAILATAIAVRMYESRHSEFVALKRSQTLVSDLEQAIQSLTDAQGRLIHAAKMASLGRFVAGVAHELRNPLNFVVNFSKLTSEIVKEIVETGPELRGQLQEAIENLDMILKHAVRADSIVSELIHQSDVTPTKPVPTDLNGLVHEQLERVRATYADNGSNDVNVVSDCDPDCGLVELYPTTFARAIRSVIDNAFIASSQSESDSANVAVSTSRTPGGIRVEVRDNGPGVSPESSEWGFEPFYTGWKSGTYTGLGLAIAFQVVTEGHGGTIELENDQSGGARVTIEIPIDSPASDTMDSG